MSETKDSIATEDDTANGLGLKLPDFGALLERMRKGDPLLTLGEKYEPAMKIERPYTARVFLIAAVQHTMKLTRCNKRKAWAIEKANVGYWAGYYSFETRQRVERLFKCEHPILGKAIDEHSHSVKTLIGLGEMMAR